MGVYSRCTGNAIDSETSRQRATARFKVCDMGVACMREIEKAELVMSRLLERSSRMRKDPSSIACMQL